MEFFIDLYFRFATLLSHVLQTLDTSPNKGSSTAGIPYTRREEPEIVTKIHRRLYYYHVIFKVSQIYHQTNTHEEIKTLIRY